MENYLPSARQHRNYTKKKFAMLLSMIGQFWPSTVLNTWAEDNKSQGLTNGKDLPYLRNYLEVYCPHFKKKTP
eukprot:10544538-Ditylum_brightwellii.AAC.1